MRPAQEQAQPKIRCASVHSSTGADPAGSAPTWDALLVVEIPLPWPKDIAMALPFSRLVGEPAPTITGADGRRWRPQGVVPSADPDGGVRVMAFERPGRPGRGDDPAGPFRRREWLLPGAEEVSSLAQQLLSADPLGVATFQRWRDDPDPTMVDLLVCTHGTRDMCCGGATAMFGELVAALGGPRGASWRLWRTSHSGGHRFAPTALSLPDGTAWAHLTPGLGAALVTRSGEASAVAGHCRGSLTLEDPQSQVADREGLREFGWSWLDSERAAIVVSRETENLAATVEVSSASGLGARVRVELDRRIPMPECGSLAGSEGPQEVTEPVWRAARVERTQP